MQSVKESCAALQLTNDQQKYEVIVTINCFLHNLAHEFPIMTLYIHIESRNF